MKSLEQLDRWIAGRVKSWTGRVAGGQHSRQLLEIRRDILEEIRDAVQPTGEGRSVFPYTAVRIRVAAAEETERSALSAAFTDDTLPQEIRELLVEAGCSVPEGFSVETEVIDDPALAWSARPFQVAYSTSQKRVIHAAAEPRPPAVVRVLKGAADPDRYEIASDRFNIGRLKEVMGERDGLRRRNDLAFDDTETTVSREHAYIRYDPNTGKFRVYDTNSARGTVVFREGRRLEVPRGAGAGLQLRSGDEIHFGTARVVFEIG